MSGNILILDDEQNYLLVLDAILSDAGYKATPLSDPEMGLAFLEESEVDVVITDMSPEEFHEDSEGLGVLCAVPSMPGWDDGARAMNQLCLLYGLG